jgi:hypothetical protein
LGSGAGFMPLASAAEQPPHFASSSLPSRRRMMNSTRRFFSNAVSLSPGSIGQYEPKPAALRRSFATPSEIRRFSTASDRCWVRILFPTSLPRLSAWPATSTKSSSG